MQMFEKRLPTFLTPWLNWKALRLPWRLPWRQKFLVGHDLEGNSYWEFRIRGCGPEARLRRIVQYPNNTHLGDVKVSAQWHQWLRQTRANPPSLEEQNSELWRQQQMKYLAAEADARWDAKPRLVNTPGESNGQSYEASDNTQEWASTGSTTQLGGMTQRQGIISSGSHAQGQPDQSRVTTQEDPWKKHRHGGPGERWQPQSWLPLPAKK